MNLVRQSEGFTYFNRPGADMAGHEAQMLSCAGDVQSLFAPMLIALMRQTEKGGLVTDGILPDLIHDAQRHQMVMATIEDCMVVRGWRVVRVPDDEGAVLARLKPAELSTRLAAWVGSDAPHGQIVRVWDNDAAKTSTIKSMMPGMSSQPSLSFQTLSASALSQLRPPPTIPNRPSKMQMFKEAKPDELASPPPEAAVIVITLRNSAPRDWTRMTLLRLGPDANIPAWTVDSRPELISLYIKDTVPGQPKGSPVERTYAFVAPPGRWAIGSFFDLAGPCRGAPFFDVRPGEVLYAGALDFGRDGVPLDLSLVPARVRLQGQPALQERLRPARWTNGATFRCGIYGYALELPGLPFAPGYKKAGTP